GPRRAALRRMLPRDRAGDAGRALPVTPRTRGFRGNDRRGVGQVIPRGTASMTRLVAGATAVPRLAELARQTRHGFSRRTLSVPGVPSLSRRLRRPRHAGGACSRTLPSRFWTNPRRSLGLDLPPAHDVSEDLDRDDRLAWARGADRELLVEASGRHLRIEVDDDLLLARLVAGLDPRVQPPRFGLDRADRVGARTWPPRPHDELAVHRGPAPHVAEIERARRHDQVGEHGSGDRQRHDWRARVGGPYGDRLRRLANESARVDPYWDPGELAGRHEPSLGFGRCRRAATRTVHSVDANVCPAGVPEPELMGERGSLLDHAEVVHGCLGDEADDTW